MHRTPRLLLAVLSVLALALSACGGDDLSSKSATDILKETFGPNKPVKSGKLDLRLALTTAAGSGTGPLKLAVNGPFQSVGGGKLPKFSFGVTIDAGGQAIPVGAVSTGTQGWLKVANQPFAIDPKSFGRFRSLYEKDQQRAKGAKNPTFESLGINPSGWLAKPKKAGEETVGGTQTVHVTSKVDISNFLDDVQKLLARADATGAAKAAGASGSVPTTLTPAQRLAVEQSVKNTSLDVYSGKDDGTLRRLNLQITYDVPPKARTSSGGLTTGTLGLDLVITELNEPQTIVAPRNARPLSELTASGVTGAGGATATAPQTTTPAPGTGASGGTGSAPAAYQQCLQAAGGDVAKIQQCAPLLNGG